MQQTAETRGWRRAMGVVCALLGLAGAAIVSTRADGVARAESEEADPAGLDRGAPAPVAEAAPLPPPSPPRVSLRPERLSTAAGKDVVAIPPRAEVEPGAPAPLRILLHGMCGDAEGMCARWGASAPEGSWLACPSGNASCGGADDWKGSGEEKAAAIDAAIEALDRAYGPDLVTHRGGDVLVGFSRGAFVARDAAFARPGRFRALVLLGASMTPDAARLRAAGVRRVVMGAGDYDGASPVMRRAARALDAAGLPTRYVSLGPIAHDLPADLGSALRDAIAWIDEDAP